MIRFYHNFDLTIIKKNNPFQKDFEVNESLSVE